MIFERHLRFISATFTWSLLFTIVVLVVIDCYGLLILKRHGITSRIVFVDNLSKIKPSYFVEDSLYWTKLFPEKNPLVLITALMNKVSKIEAGPRGNTRELFEYAQKGDGLLCDAMARIYLTILNAKGFESRLIYLTRALGDIYDAHTTVEIKIDGHWAIYDPTFNVTFEKNGEVLGAKDIHAALLDGSYGEIKPKFHGEVSYPARLDEYYMNWLPLFNNVFVRDQSDTLLQRLPPLRYWFGSKMYTERLPSYKYDNLRLHNTLYFFFVVVLPITISLSFLITMWVLVTSRKGNNVRHRRRVNIQ